MNNIITSAPILSGQDAGQETQLSVIVKNNADLWRKVAKLEESISKNTEITKGRISDNSSIGDIMDYIERERIDAQLFALMCSEI